MDSIPLTMNPAPEPTRSGTIPVSCRIILFAAVSIVVGVLWDISWHRTIGRDTFWTPAHMAIYLGGMLGGLTGGWLILQSTFSDKGRAEESGLRIWGFRGPTGAWVSVWGALAMLTSAPFDDWWHNAYGLDVRIISPPHMVLAVGMWAIVWGALLLLLKEQNLRALSNSSKVSWFYLSACGILLAMGATVLIEESWPNQQRSMLFYQISAATYPAYLLGLSRPSRNPWAATIIGGIYMAIYLGFCWVLPLFPAEPKLGPIYNHVDRMVPLPFPHWLILPGLLIDLLRRTIGTGMGWRRDVALILCSAIGFVMMFGVCQWFFSGFLLTDFANNWFFAADRHWGYNESSDEWRFKFWRAMDWSSPDGVLFKGIGVTLLLAFLSSTFGLLLGNWMTRIKR